MDDDEPMNPILPRPWTYDLERIDWWPTPLTEETFIDLTFRKGDEVATPAVLVTNQCAGQRWLLRTVFWIGHTRHPKSRVGSHHG
jgi:hypothetical protein